MSISRGTSLSRLLSNNETVTIRVNARTAALVIAAASFALGVSVGAYLMPELSRLRDQVRQRRDRAAALSSLIEQAKLMPVSYDLATPGMVVDWCIDHPSKGFSFVAGRPSEPVLWTNEGDVPETIYTKGACRRTLARVVSREPLGLKLTFLGQP